MKEETYLKAKAIMDEVEHLRKLKKFQYPAECYSVSFSPGNGADVTANAIDIGVSGLSKIIDLYISIIDDLITKKLQRLEELE